MWIPSLELTEDDKQIIINNDWLNDRITLLRMQYPIARRLDTTLFALRPSGYDSSGFNTVQIILNENWNYWFTSSTFRMAIEIADSMTPPKLTESAQKQLKSRYECLAKDSAQKCISNVNDCGLYAISLFADRVVDTYQR